MKKMTALLLAIALSGCMGGDHLTSWEGRPAVDLIYAWGPPDKAVALPDGRRVLSYVHPDLCEALFRVTAAGTVESASVDGTIGGCNGLLLGKPSAAR